MKPGSCYVVQIGLWLKCCTCAIKQSQWKQGIQNVKSFAEEMLGIEPGTLHIVGKSANPQVHSSQDPFTLWVIITQLFVL